MKLTELKCWPEYDFYFKVGVSVLYEHLKKEKCKRKYSFLNLNGYTLRDFLMQLPVERMHSVVIVSSPRLIPLAYYWMDRYSTICAVFDSATCIEDIISTLNVTTIKDDIEIPRHCRYRITEKEILTLYSYFLLGGLNNVQKRHSCSYSTVRGWKSKLEYKLGVRKLEYLPLSE